MANDASKVAVAVTGSVYKAPLATAAPTSQASSLNVAFLDLGYIGEDGVTQTLPGAGDVNQIKAWQNGATVRTIRSASEDLPTFSFVALETNKTTLETYYGTTVTQTATEGSLVYNSQSVRTSYSWVIDVVDGAELERIYIPDGVVTEVGDRVYANGEPIGYEVTIEANYNTTLSGNAKLWTTRAKS
jgi:hypothetical protein